MTPSAFVSALADMRLPSVFNPYVDRCSVHDRADAAKTRRKNLEAFLNGALKEKVETIWIARDLGYRGGRRTGVPLTDEVHLDAVRGLLGNITLKRATHGPVMAERTAAVVWRVLARIRKPVVLWNVFPFHPHEPDDHLSNRCHTSAERLITLPLFEALIEMVQPKRVIAIGRDAQLALKDFGIPLSAVRHPSYGGQSEFIAGLYGLYGVQDHPPAELDLCDEPRIKPRSSYSRREGHTVPAE